MKKLLLAFFCCLIVCGCGNKIKHYECENSSTDDKFQMTLFKSFDCKENSVFNDKGTTTTIYDSENTAKYMYKTFSTLYSDVTINGSVVKYSSSETQEFIDKIGNCSQYLNHWQELGLSCSEKSAKN